MNSSAYIVSAACAVAFGCMAVFLAMETTSLAGQPSRSGPPPKSGQSQKQPKQKPAQPTGSRIRKLPNKSGRQQMQQSIAQQQANRNQQAMVLLGAFEHARQERDSRTDDQQQQQTETYEQSSEDAAQQALLASGDNQITFRIQNMTRETVHLMFYAIDGSWVWPGHDEVFILDDNKIHRIILQGKNGEGIAYGAWFSENPDKYWGRGNDNSVDDGSYYKCDGGITPIIELND